MAKNETGVGRARGASVAVVGAAGHTGRFVVAELLKRGVVPVGIVRPGGRAAELRVRFPGLEVREVSLELPANLDSALADVSAVINCAGPFLDTAEPVLRAALKAGAHYADVTAEQASAWATLGEGRDAALAAGVNVLPAMGFFGGFADLLATAAMGDWQDADEICTGIALDFWHPTAGTRLTGARNTAVRQVVTGGNLAPLAQPAAQKGWRFPAPFGAETVIELPFSEIVLITDHIRAGEVRTWMSARALSDIRNTETPPPTAADALGRSAQRFAVEVRVRRGAETRQAAAAGQDIYAFSAPLVCEAVKRVLEGRVASRGARAPGAVFDAPDFLDALRPDLSMLTIRAG
jgi:short subunit dehydrogenase-like uncharacterized protein